MAFLEHDGRTIHYRLLGESDKPLLVLAHPLGMTQAVWDDLLPGLLPRFRVLTWDLPGHGGSAAASPECEAITPEDLAQETLALVGAADAEPFHFVGTSIGGVIGQQLLSRYPEVLLSAMLTNTGPVIGTPDAWNTRASDVRSKGLPAMAEGIVPRWFGPLAAAEQPALLDGWKVVMGRGDAHSYALLCEMLGLADFRGAFGDRNVPVTLVGGSDDMATPPAALEALADAIGGPPPHILDRVGHVPSVESPQQLLPLIEQHLPS
ncbi:alpha/beta fold hydrolase [Marinobacter sp. R17]|uniref:alpha/beta fold hydrolase n=1 Tax=Marinobacter sp. R17 TaxID=2484250 RepID=UPI000F4B8873|nr:alpha/beta fold hydrolase [Marinobacter sp. R17]ROT96174.1 alpha/beta fold hydrolase [Marinobacter sp. R17]